MSRQPVSSATGQKGYGLSRGLKPQSVEGSFVIYSAGEGQSAMDRLSDADGDPNSVFTRTLLPLLRADAPLIDAIKAAQEKTYALAASVDHGQTPAYYDEVLGRACLSRECRSTAPAASYDETLAAMIDNAKSADFLATLIAGLPEGPLKERAKARVEALKKAQIWNLTSIHERSGSRVEIKFRRYRQADVGAMPPILRPPNSHLSALLDCARRYMLDRDRRPRPPRLTHGNVQVLSEAGGGAEAAGRSLGPEHRGVQTTMTKAVEAGSVRSPNDHVVVVERRDTGATRRPSGFACPRVKRRARSIPTRGCLEL